MNAENSLKLYDSEFWQVPYKVFEQSISNLLTRVRSLPKTVLFVYETILFRNLTFLLSKCNANTSGQFSFQSHIALIPCFLKDFIFEIVCLLFLDCLWVRVFAEEIKHVFEINFTFLKQCLTFLKMAVIKQSACGTVIFNHKIALD